MSFNSKTFFCLDLFLFSCFPPPSPFSVRAFLIWLVVPGYMLRFWRGPWLTGLLYQRTYSTCVFRVFFFPLDWSDFGEESSTSLLDWRYVEIPIPNVLGGGALGRCLGHEDGALLSGVSALLKETPQSSLAPSKKWRHSEKMNQEELTPDTESAGTVILDWAPELWEINVYCLSHQVYASLL